MTEPLTPENARLDRWMAREAELLNRIAELEVVVQFHQDTQTQIEELQHAITMVLRSPSNEFEPIPLWAFRALKEAQH